MTFLLGCGFCRGRPAVPRQELCVSRILKDACPPAREHCWATQPVIPFHEENAQAHMSWSPLSDKKTFWCWRHRHDISDTVLNRFYAMQQEYIFTGICMACKLVDIPMGPNNIDIGLPWMKLYSSGFGALSIVCGWIGLDRTECEDSTMSKTLTCNAALQITDLRSPTRTHDMSTPTHKIQVGVALQCAALYIHVEFWVWG